MKENVFCAPDYMPRFACKCGSCRQSCCSGWSITLTAEDAARLRTLPCNDKVTEVLQGHFARNADGSGHFVRLEDGRCPFLAPDGLCDVQRRHGEKALPEVCKLFPRRPTPGELAFSSSCERVTELLLAQEEELTFPLFDRAEILQKENEFKPCSTSEQLRRRCFDLLQNRAVALRRRCVSIVLFLFMLDRLEKAGDKQGLYDLITHGAGNAVALSEGEAEPDCMLPLLLCCAFFGRSSVLSRYWPMLCTSLSLQLSPEKWTDEALQCVSGIYAGHREAFLLAHPKWERQLERVLCNHMFFAQFPVAGCGFDFAQEGMLFCAEYALWQFVPVCICSGKGDDEQLVDVLAALARLMEHSGFDKHCVERLSHSALGYKDSLLQSIYSL